MARQLAGKGEDQVSDEEAANTKKLKSGKIQVMALLDGAGGNRQKIWLKVTVRPLYSVLCGLQFSLRCSLWGDWEEGIEER